MRQSRNARAGWVADEILEYLVQNPEAADTLEGICEWWLLERRVRQTLAEVQAALRELTDKEFLVIRRGEDGRAHYRFNRQREAQVRAHLRQRQSRRDRNRSNPGTEE